MHSHDSFHREHDEAHLLTKKSVYNCNSLAFSFFNQTPVVFHSVLASYTCLLTGNGSGEQAPSLYI